jgi:hypothetical protein
MLMKIETIQKLDAIIENHNAGKSDDDMAKLIGCNVATIRAFLALARKLGTEVTRNRVGPAQMKSPEARAIMRDAMREARKQISGLVLNGRG